MSDTLSEDMLLSGILPSEQEILEQAADQIDALATQGLSVDVDPDVAELMGAIQETALSTFDAEQSIHSVDLETGIVISIDGAAA
ncbi:hypothetical protein [uncultured Kiloniella sp.]|uniref:hypothetical protein n=1 Tax=uncultured Kiloniella sp. TaxID=1133091 RepID=UPI00260E3C3A|nr:hypothetical protein [uncultured Kiloniella sp.]